MDTILGIEYGASNVLCYDKVEIRSMCLLNHTDAIFRTSRGFAMIVVGFSSLVGEFLEGRLCVVG